MKSVNFSETKFPKLKTTMNSICNLWGKLTNSKTPSLPILECDYLYHSDNLFCFVAWESVNSCRVDNVHSMVVRCFVEVLMYMVMVQKFAQLCYGIKPLVFGRWWWTSDFQRINQDQDSFRSVNKFIHIVEPIHWIRLNTKCFPLDHNFWFYGVIFICFIWKRWWATWSF